MAQHLSESWFPREKPEGRWLGFDSLRAAMGRGRIPVFWPYHKPRVMRWPMLAVGDSRIRVGVISLRTTLIMALDPVHCCRSNIIGVGQGPGLTFEWPFSTWGDHCSLKVGAEVRPLLGDVAVLAHLLVGTYPVMDCT